MKLERYDEPQVRQEAVSVGPGSQTPTHSNSGSEGLVEGGNALAGAANKIGGIIDEERQRAEELRVSDSDLKFARDAGDLLYNAETGYLNTENEAALDTAKVHDEIEKRRQAYMASLPTERAQKAFDLRTRVRADAYRSTVERHAGSQREKLYDANANNAIQVAVDDSVKVYNQFDPKTGVNDKVETLIALSYETVVPHLRRRGVPAEQIEKAKEAVATQVYTAVLNEYKARREFTAGKAFLDTVADTMGDKATAFVSVFAEGAKEAEIAKEGLEIYSAIQEQVTDPATGRFDPAAARALFDTFDPTTRAKLDTFVHARIAQAEVDQGKLDVQRVARLSIAARETGLVDTQSEDFLALDDKGKDTALALLKREEREKRYDRAMARQEQAEIDDELLGNLADLPFDDLADLSDEDLHGKFSGLSKKGLRRAKEKRAAAKLARERGQAVSYEQAHGRAKQIAQLVYGTKNNKKALAGALYQSIAGWYDGEIINGKTPTDKDLAEKIGKAVILYDIPISWNSPSGADKYGFQLDSTAGLTPHAKQPYPALVQNVLNAKPPPAAAPTQTAPQGQKITNGKLTGVLAPGKPMPAGWKAVP